MALIKLGGPITDIRGRIGGDVFKRDGSGLHITKLANRVKPQFDLDQHYRHAWYGGKKREESLGGYPEENYELPKSDRTAIIYSLEILYGHKQPSLTPPTETQIEYSGLTYNWIVNWVNINWKDSFLVWGLTKEIMVFLMMKWCWVAKGTWGFSTTVALQAAVVNMQAFILQQAAAVAVPFLTLWAGILALGAFFAFVDWLEGTSGWVDFTRGDVIIRKQNTLYWGGLAARASKQMYDFIECGPMPFPAWQWRIVADRPAYQMHLLYFRHLWQTYSRYFLWHNVYSWSNIRCRYRGWAYRVGKNIWRLQCPPSQQKYWGKEIGWYISQQAACLYTSQFDANFES